MELRYVCVAQMQCIEINNRSFKEKKYLFICMYDIFFVVNLKHFTRFFSFLVVFCKIYIS